MPPSLRRFFLLENEQVSERSRWVFEFVEQASPAVPAGDRDFFTIKLLVSDKSFDLNLLMI